MIAKLLLKRASDSCRSFLTQAYDPPLTFGEVFAPLVTNCLTKRFFLPAKQKFFANRVGDEAAIGPHVMATWSVAKWPLLMGLDLYRAYGFPVGAVAQIHL